MVAFIHVYMQTNFNILANKLIKVEEVLEEEVEEVLVAAVEDVSNSILYASGVCSSEGGKVSQHECDLVIKFKEMNDDFFWEIS